MIVSNDDKTVFQSSILNSDSIIHGFSTRAFGDGRDIDVLKKYLSKKNITYKHIVQPHQTHSTNIQIVSKADLTKETVLILDCDGLVTVEENVVLTVVTADCVPIIYYDSIAKVAGISHQGWKGTTDNLPRVVIEKMIASGANASQIQCVMGPAINSCCYHLNLYKMNRETVQKSGVSKENIDIFPFCTCCDEERFYSYRREGKINGEMIHFVMMR
ncbi:hypothetical protein BH09PAT2_BH09PAT2_06100 [soil metagenome]